MVDRTSRSCRGRRGVILILVLGMLALMAVIGVTFTALSGQARINARNFAERLNLPDADVLMDLALDQLINDTSNPLSAIRGHSSSATCTGTTPSATASWPDCPAARRCS